MTNINDTELKSVAAINRLEESLDLLMIEVMIMTVALLW